MNPPDILRILPLLEWSLTSHTYIYTSFYISIYLRTLQSSIQAPVTGLKWWPRSSLSCAYPAVPACRTSTSLAPRQSLAPKGPSSNLGEERRGPNPRRLLHLALPFLDPSSP